MALTGAGGSAIAARSLRVWLASAFLALAGIGVAQAQTVIVQGNRRVDADTIRSYVSGRGAGSLDDIRNQLVGTGLFADVRVTAGAGGAIVVAVRENEVINRVVFEGNRRVTKEVLVGEVLSKDRGAFNPQTVQADIDRIIDVYKRSGRGLAKVSYRIVSLPNERVDLVFTIDEGDKTGVREINFVGNNSFSAYRLRRLMITTEMNLLSFLKTSDVYDPDRIAADEELIRRFYLKNGYADFNIVSTNAVFDPGRTGWIVTITVDEGQPYRVGAVQVESRISDIPADTLRRHLRTAPGDVYNAEAVERSVTAMTTEVVSKGYAFAQVRPTGSRDQATYTVSLTFIVEEGPRVYVERIVLRGNIRTRDYVIRRELDLEEGDAYNKVLIDRAERRLNNLGYFKRVRFSNEPGSTPDRVILNIDVEDQPTGAFSLGGGYSTQDGFIGEVSVSETNFLGRGHYVRVASTLGQRSRGVEFSFTEPYFLDQRLAVGVDLFAKYTDNTAYGRYETRVNGGTLRAGFSITENFGALVRYSLYQTRLKVPNTFKQPFNDCTVPLPGYTALNPDGTALFPNCAFDGEASVAIKEAAGSTITSLVGMTFAYNTLDNNKEPRNGFYADFRPDIAGLGGDSRFFRAATDMRYYHELPWFEDVVGVARLQAGHIMGFGGNNLRLIDHFNLGPSLVRGFASGGIGPRDLNGDPRTNAIGGTTYIGGSVEAQFPILGLPREIGLRGAVFADAGTLFGYKGRRVFDLNFNGTFDCGNPTVQPECVAVKDDKSIRSSVGASVLWASPMGPIRFDYAIATSKGDNDRTQAFRFSGGAKF
jgi:outer membrane protein insertion porin family